MATNFEAALLRLKGALLVTTDKEVAELLGMSPNALNERKRRDAFPEDKVRALAARLHFDADYVVTGVAQAAQELIDAAREGKPMKKVAPEDQALLAHWHQCAPADQQLMLQLIKRLSTNGVLIADEAHPTLGDAELARRIAVDVKPGVTATPSRSLTPDGRYPKRVDEPALVLHDKPAKKGK